jgi:hypothetical protein
MRADIKRDLTESVDTIHAEMKQGLSDVAATYAANQACNNKQFNTIAAYSELGRAANPGNVQLNAVASAGINDKAPQIKDTTAKDQQYRPNYRATKATLPGAMTTNSRAGNSTPTQRFPSNTPNTQITKRDGVTAPAARRVRQVRFDSEGNRIWRLADKPKIEWQEIPEYFQTWLKSYNIHDQTSWDDVADKRCLLCGQDADHQQGRCVHVYAATEKGQSKFQAAKAAELVRRVMDKQNGTSTVNFVGELLPHFEAAYENQHGTQINTDGSAAELFETMCDYCDVGMDESVELLAATVDNTQRTIAEALESQ